MRLRWRDRSPSEYSVYFNAAVSLHAMESSCATHGHLFHRNSRRSILVTLSSYPVAGRDAPTSLSRMSSYSPFSVPFPPLLWSILAIPCRVGMYVSEDSVRCMS